MVFTFEPHPQKILFPEREFLLITPREEKQDIIRENGIDVLVCLPFTKEFAAKNPQDFVHDMLVQTLHIQEMYVGYNSRFGQYQQGTPLALVEWGKTFGFGVTIVPPISWRDLPVSSTKIRQLLKEGDVTTAAQLLNRPYAVDGEVVVGKQRGGTVLGYPTANVNIQHELIPRKGVYICQVIWRGQSFAGVVNIGTNPTFETGQHVTVEVHLFDFKDDLYGSRIKVLFLQRLRDEIRFADYHQLMHQIAQDIHIAQAYFAHHSSSVVDSVAT